MTHLAFLTPEILEHAPGNLEPRILCTIGQVTNLFDQSWERGGVNYSALSKVPNKIELDSNNIHRMISPLKTIDKA